MGGALSGSPRPNLLRRLAAAFRRILPSRSAKRFGREGEAAAARYLEKKGYKILERNFSVRGGEVDIVAEKEGLVFAVEVKSRSNRAFGTPQEAVTPWKARRLLRAGRAYCRRHNISVSKLRADVIAIEADGSGALNIRHYQNAISPVIPHTRRR